VATNDAVVTPDNLVHHFIERYKNNRRGFVREILKVAKVEKWQDDVMAALDAGETRITIRSGHGVGKTALLSWLEIHFLHTRYPCKVAVTAPSASQLFDALASEVKMWLKKLEANVPALAKVFDTTSDRVFMIEAPEAAFCSYRTSRKESPEALQGYHADNVLLIADEASGVHDAVFEAASGSMSTKGAITILAGNPTRANGFFYKTHTGLLGQDGAPIWKRYKVSCFDSSRVDSKYIDEERAYGMDSNRYRIRVLGDFPKGDDDTLIGRDFVESSVLRPIIPPHKEPIYWGVDVARSLFRDASALCKRKGPIIPEKIKLWHYPDVMQVTGQVKREWDETQLADRPEAIFVDVIGFGAGVADRLIELDLPAVGINVGESPPVMAKAVKLRDELWLRARDWFMTRMCSIPDGDEGFIDELCAPTVVYQSNGNAKVESKDDIRARGILEGKSPDRADAFCLTFAYTAAVTAGSMLGNKSRKGPLRRTGSRRV
jgi:phage terminase large subunit